jgi:hypothetical protein
VKRRTTKTNEHWVGIGKLQVLACELDVATNSFSMIKKSRFAFDLLLEQSFA